MSTILRALTGLVLLATAIEAAGMYALYSEEQLVENSNLIVVATLLGRTTIRVGPDATQMTVGVLAIENRLKGSSTDAVALLILPSPGAPVASDAISYTSGQRGVWFLRQQPGTSGLFLADHPQRYETLEDDGQRIAALQRIIAASK